MTSFAKNNGNGHGNGRVNGHGNGNSEEKNIEKAQNIANNEDKNVAQNQNKENKITGKSDRESISADMQSIHDDEKSCWRAFGHLIAPGWIRHNGPIDISLECNLPFGIAKKISGSNASSTPDVTAPVISGIRAMPAKDQVEIRWTTDERSDSAVFWSTTANVDASSAAVHVLIRNESTRDHQIVIKRLTATTTYYFIVRSRDVAGNAAFSSEASFTTKSASADNNPPMISSVVTLAGTTSIQIGWKTNEDATGRVYFGTALPLNIVTAPFLDDATSSKNHVLVLTGLLPQTTYYLVVESTDNSGNVATSSTLSFATTPVSTTTTPVISVIDTTAGSTTAKIAWKTAWPASSLILYDTTTPVNPITALTASSSALATDHEIDLFGLATSTVYFYTVSSTNDAGTYAISGRSFTTLAR
jgi:hypothetical protein